MFTKILWTYFNGNTTIEMSEFKTLEDAVEYINKVLKNSKVAFSSGQVVQFGENTFLRMKW